MEFYENPPSVSRIFFARTDTNSDAPVIFDPRSAGCDLHLKRDGLKNVKLTKQFPMKNVIGEVRKVWRSVV